MPNDREWTPAAFSERVDRLGYDDRVIDKETQREDHPKQRDRVQADADEVEGTERRGHDGEDEQRGDDRRPPRDQQQGNEGNRDDPSEDIGLQRADLLADLGGEVDGNERREAVGQQAVGADVGQDVVGRVTNRERVGAVGGDDPDRDAGSKRRGVGVRRYLVEESFIGHCLAAGGVDAALDQFDDFGLRYQLAVLERGQRGGRRRFEFFGRGIDRAVHAHE